LSGVVWSDMEPGTVSADSGKAVETGTERRNRCGAAYHYCGNHTIVHTQGSARLYNAGTPLFQYKQFLVGWGGSYGSEYRGVYLYHALVLSLRALLFGIRQEGF
ncbi:MAG: hypothetical protein PHN80_17140, partial [Hespellia sp.]|nr:hypothetical protein [Hespellia sp.]